jgi:hypothetical protein
MLISKYAGELKAGERPNFHAWLHTINDVTYFAWFHEGKQCPDSIYTIWPGFVVPMRH